MIIHCHICKYQLSEQGALLFSPPSGTNEPICVKYHLCKKCYPLLGINGWQPISTAPNPAKVKYILGGWWDGQSFNVDECFYNTHSQRWEANNRPDAGLISHWMLWREPND